MAQKFGYKQTQETKNKIKIALSGKQKSEQHKKNMSISKIGKKLSKETILRIKKNACKYWLKKHRSEETKQKIKIALLGKHHSKESILKMINTKKERRYKHSEETKRKISISNKGKILSPEHLKKFTNTPERNIKISLARLGKHPTENTRKKMSEIRKIKMKEGKILQKMPIKDTSIEIKIQNFLKQLNIEFFTHQYIKEIEHGYQCDILIPSMNLVIECDGDYWHKYPIGNDIDHIRTRELLDKGFRVLRLWENEIKIMQLYDFKYKLEEINGI